MPPPAEGLASRLLLGPALRSQPDGRLVTLVREGYEAAFEEIVRRYGRPLGRYAASIVGGRSEDVLQEAFAKALPALQRNDAEIDLRPWLFRIVRNTALNDLRDSPPAPELLAETLAGGRNPAEELEQRERLADLMRRLRELPEPQRAAIVMRELEGLGHEEIATALGLTGGGARQAIYRARQALRDGAGMLLPLPLLRLLVDHGAEAAAGAGTGGALAAAGASAGGAGASGALKLGVVAAVVAGSVGAGVAVQSHGNRSSTKARAAPATRERTGAGATAAAAATHAASAVHAASVRSARRHDDPGAGHGAGRAGSQPSAPGPARGLDQPGGRHEGHRVPPRRHRRPDGRRNGRHGGRHDDLSPHRDHRGPRPERNGHPSPGREGGELGDGSRGDGGGEDVRSPDGSGRHGGSEPDGGRDGGAPPPPPEETSGDESGGSGESTALSGSSGTGREYEEP